VAQTAAVDGVRFPEWKALRIDRKSLREIADAKQHASAPPSEVTRSSEPFLLKADC
jgi:hypothetical protein